MKLERFDIDTPEEETAYTEMYVLKLQAVKFVVTDLDATLSEEDMEDNLEDISDAVETVHTALVLKDQLEEVEYETVTILNGEMKIEELIDALEETGLIEIKQKDLFKAEETINKAFGLNEIGIFH